LDGDATVDVYGYARLNASYDINEAVICNPVVQIAALKQPVYCAQFPAIFQG
jgi:hypothetical protein